MFIGNTRVATATFNRQFTDDLQILAGYVFSKTIDDTSFGSEEFQNPFASRTKDSTV
jgi:hypothetical protein